MGAQVRPTDRALLEAMRALTEAVNNELAPGIVELPLVPSGTVGVNAAFVMAVQFQTATTTRITVAGVGPLIIDLTLQETLDALRGL